MSPDDDRIAALESDVGDVKERLGRLEGQAARVEGAWWLVKRVSVITAALLTIGSALAAAVFTGLMYLSSRGV